jgi:hypothetical protein
MGMIRRIPFGEWLPDLGEHNNEGLYKVKGAVSSGGRYFPPPTFNGTDLTGNAGATYDMTETYGLHVHTSNTNPRDLRFYVGTNNDILRSTAVNLLSTERATAAGIANAPDTISGWQFTSFGDTIYAASFNGTTGNFLRAATPSTAFATFVAATTPTTYSPIPRFVSTIKNHLLIANVEAQTTLGEFTANTVYPNLVMWSASDDPTRWGDEEFANYPETVGSSYQHLYDEFGPITGLVGGADVAYIFKPRAIYRMEGPEWSFHPVVTGAGSIYPNSIVRFYNDLYFWGPCGPALLRYGSSEVENIGLGKVQRAVTEFQNYKMLDYCFEIDTFTSPEGEIDITGNTTQLDISCVADYRCGLIAWFCAEATVETGTTDLSRRTGCLTYDVKTGAFSFFNVPTKAMFAKSVPMYGKNPVGSGSNGFSQHSVLDGTTVVLLNDSMTRGDDVQLAQARGDTSTLDSIQLTNPVQSFAYDWFPEFTTSFNPLVTDDDRGPLPTSVRRVRVPLSIQRFAETAASGAVNVSDPWSLKVEVTVRSKNRFIGEYEEATGSWDAIDAWQTGDQWIDLNGGKGSSEATYHQFVIRILTQDNDNPHVFVKSAILHLRDLSYFEVEFESGSGQSGSTYIA